MGKPFVSTFGRSDNPHVMNKIFKRRVGVPLVVIDEDLNGTDNQALIASSASSLAFLWSSDE